MTEQDKQLLLVDLCSRLPYGVKVKQGGYVGELRSFDKYTISFNNSCALPKPYLRPMSSMTLEELEEYRHFGDHIRDAECKIHIANYNQFDWLNAHHFDFRGLISKGLAIEAPEGMYKVEE